MSAQTARAWIDFRALRSQLDFWKVLEHYDVKIKRKGDRATGFCPLPTHQGKRKSPSFSVDLQRGIWQCFGCQARGNVLDFACRMEGANPSHGADIRSTALKLQTLFLLPTFSDDPKGVEARRACVDSADQRTKPPSTAKRYANVLVNEPLDFELQTLDFDHPYLRKRGFTDETIRHFGLGYCNRGMLKHRIAIRLDDADGRLVGYAGRLTEDRLINEDNPKYRFPGDRERSDTLLEFRKSLLLYNAHRIRGKAQELFVVEGFASVWWLTQHRYPDAVALMGADCSEEQAKLIIGRVALDGRIWLMPDGNAAGILCARSLLERLSPYRFVHWVKLEDDEQPTDCDAHQLEALLTI